MDADDELVSPGFCTYCQRPVQDSMAIAYVETGSGPGGIVEACVRHARESAGHPWAPDWLRSNIAELDARAQQEARPLHMGSGEAS